MYTVYTLIDPRDDVVRYVGITEDVYTRFSQHLQCAGNNLDKNEWIRGLKNHNLMLIMRTIEVVETLEEARDREQHWIHHHLRQGVRLFNVDIARSFTYEDFLAKFGKSPEVKDSKNQKPRNPPPAIHRAGQPSMGVKAAAAYLGVSESMVRKLRTTGKLRATPRNKNLLLTSSVYAYQASKEASNGHTKEPIQADQLEQLVV